MLSVSSTAAGPRAILDDEPAETAANYAYHEQTHPHEPSLLPASRLASARRAADPSAPAPGFNDDGDETNRYDRRMAKKRKKAEKARKNKRK